MNAADFRDLPAIAADKAAATRDEAAAALLRIVWLVLILVSPALVLLAWKAAL